MEDLPYDPSRCLTFWFRLVQSPHLQWPFSAGVRVERVDSPPRRDGGTLTFPQEMIWPAVPIKEGDNIFQVKAAVPVPINSHDQVLFVTLRDVLDRVVARVHVTYDEARTLRHVGFTEWYPAEPAPLPEYETDQDDMHHKVTFKELAKNERTTFRLVLFLDHGDLYGLPLDPASSLHPSMRLMSSDVDIECLAWASAIAPEDPGKLLLAGAFRLPVQAILFDTDENTSQAAQQTIQDVNRGKYLASILLDTTCSSEHDKLFVACEYASGNMSAIEVPSLADDDDYTRMTFPDGADSIHRTVVDKVGARIAVLRRLDLPGCHPAIIITLVSGRRFLEAGLVILPWKVVILSDRRSSEILSVAWRMPMGEDRTRLEICTRWRSLWKRTHVSSHSETWTLHSPSLATPPHVYLCDKGRWSDVFLPAILATTPRRLIPRFCENAINRIAEIVSNRRARGETGGYVPLGHDYITSHRDAKPVRIQRGFVDAVIPGLSAARQCRSHQWRYAAFW